MDLSTNSASRAMIRIPAMTGIIIEVTNVAVYSSTNQRIRYRTHCARKISIFRISGSSKSINNSLKRVDRSNIPLPRR